MFGLKAGQYAGNSQYDSSDGKEPETEADLAKLKDYAENDCDNTD